MNISILYEDNHLLIVEKPVNMPVQADQSEDMDLLTYVKADIKKRYNKPGNVYVGLIHRLDRPVGGAIIFAKTSKAASRMANLLRKQEITRTYLAVVRGKVVRGQGRLIDYVWKDRQKNEVYVVNENKTGAKKAVLDYTLLQTQQDLSLIKVQLQTGRSHQIRVQMKALGHPLYGDQKYGEQVNKRGQQIALWAHTLSFIHPVRGEEIQVICPPPEVVPWNIWKKS